MGPGMCRAPFLVMGSERNRVKTIIKKNGGGNTEGRVIIATSIERPSLTARSEPPSWLAPSARGLNVGRGSAGRVSVLRSMNSDSAGDGIGGGYYAHGAVLIGHGLGVANADRPRCRSRDRRDACIDSLSRMSYRRIVTRDHIASRPMRDAGYTLVLWTTWGMDCRPREEEQ